MNETIRETLLDDATRAQVEAADPRGSVWLAANAGSGKTRVLIDRVAWLLLDGTPPDRILCLTFTKAAAGEMQNRLFETLGRWAVLPDDALRVALRQVGVRTAGIDTPALRRARTLFAGAIETPGGLKIQTIHAFCAGLLRRFPLEAGVSPGFREMDEVAGARLLTDVLDAMAEDPDDAPAAEALFARLTDGGPEDFLRLVASLRADLADGPAEAALRRALDVVHDDVGAAIEAAIGPDELDLIEGLRDAARADVKSTKMARVAERMSQAILADAPTRFALCCECLLTKGGAPLKSPLTKAAVAAFGGDGVMDVVADFADRLVGARDAERGLDALARSRVLHDFAPRFLARMEREKAARGWLDFDDQVLRARDLLSRRATAQWVLWKLDGGIDHILVDEAQDTSQVQWDIVAALAGEFGAGQGARDATRTLFVVGDRKQSIFSFQGADPAAFDGMRRHFGALLPRDGDAGAPLRDHALRHSFRSAPAILRLVDRVFDAPTGAGEATEHIAFHAAKPGRVDLWPNVPVPEAPEARDWTDPVDRPAENDADVVLARHVADAVAAMIRERVPIEAREGGRQVRRPVEARDVLILVRRRNRLFDAIIAACKRRGLDLAGADRLRLADDLAVRDLVALLRVCATPEDDLSLATVLRSPLASLDEAALFAVAHGREGTLRRALRDHGGFPREVEMLRDLIGQADFLRPYELLQRILVRHDGRRRLLGRLREGAAEAIDGLLHQALAYEALEVPSLTGFLGWFEEAAVEIKREATGGAIRVMTVHGAKGLEAPVVILPDTGPWRGRPPPTVLRAPDGGPLLWRPDKALCNAPLLAAYDAHAEREAEERDRLLYVALTRAESWLVVASAGAEDADGTSWAGRVRTALEAEGAAPHPFGPGEGLRLAEGDWTTPGATPPPEPAEAEEALPPWAETPAPPPEAAARLAAPSDLGGARALAEDGIDAIEPEAARRRGTQTHLLLEHLPRLPPERRAEAAWPILARHAEVWPEDDPEAVAAEAMAVIDNHPALFRAGALTELPFVLPAEAGRPGLVGTMDRVVVEPDRITVVDFKTNRAVPASAAAVPEGILRQLGAYRAAASAIWPGRAVRVQVLWTADRTLMDLPHDAVSAAWARVAAR